MNEVANYLEQVKVFQAVSPEEAKALMDAKDVASFLLAVKAAHTAAVLWLNLAHWHKKLA